MPQPKKGYSLGSNPTHQQLMLRNLARSLFENERVRTTEAKAKLLRPFAERLITKAKQGTVHHRRQVLSVIADRDIVHKLFDEIGPRFSDRNGGYTRVVKLGPRNGDAAPMAIIELVERGFSTATTVEEGGGRRRLRRPARRRAGAGAAGEAAGAETPPDEEAAEPPEDVAPPVEPNEEDATS